MLQQHVYLPPQSGTLSMSYSGWVTRDWASVLNSDSGQNSFITRLPIEVLEQILTRLKIQDLFSLKQTCHDLHAKLDSDHLWHSVLPSDAIPIDVPPHEDLVNFTASQLQRFCLRSLRWQANWHNKSTKFTNVQRIVNAADDRSLRGIRFLPGLELLVVASVIHATEMPRSCISVYAFKHIRGSHLLASLDLRHYVRDFATAVADGGRSLGVAVSYNQGRNDTVAVHRIDLPKDTSTTSHSSRQFITPYQISIPNPSIAHKISMYKQYMAVLLVNPLGFVEGGAPMTLLIVDWIKEEHISVSLKLPPGAHPLDIKVIPPHIVIASTSAPGDQKLNITVASIAYLLSFSSKHPRNSNSLPTPVQDYDHSQVRTVQIPIIAYSSIVVSDNANIRSDQPTASVSFIIFSFNTRPSFSANKKGRLVQFLRFQLPSPNDLDSYDTFPFIHTTTATFDLPLSENPELAYVSSSGHRALWMQSPSDRGMAKIVKFAFNPTLHPNVSLGVLLPPAPLLPFRTSDCTALTFDEASGRLGFGLYNNAVYIMSL